MRDSIKYSVGAANLGSSLGGMSESALSEGYVDASLPKADPWAFDPSTPREDDQGNTSVGDQWEHRRVGAAGRPAGGER